MTAPRRNFPIIHYGLHWGAEAWEIINNAFKGKQNIGGEVTLTANAASTTLSDELIDEDSVVALMPMTSNAAAAVGTTYFSAPASGSVVINHANNGQTDRTFRYTVTG